MSVILSPHHSATRESARFQFLLRGYAGSSEPIWEHDVGEAPLGEQRAVRLRDLDLPDPPERGGILEVHAIRLDEDPAGIGFNGMWIDARGPQGGGYIIPTVPIRGQRKKVRRDDMQVVPGVIASRDVESELLLLNVVEEPVEVTLIVSSQDGVTAESAPFVVEPWSAWHDDLSRVVPRARRLLADGDGVGSLIVRSSGRILPYFGFRQGDGPIVCLDHTAPVFA
ncbi:hypothetical protein OM076_31080 [Solirubrobacter ginsenosidimutans]|uniref:Uncharacterized protein n=1 Tax=Solirubrobacter ginsenosidimutans TaxID=490573 RepID=A0A9X3N4Q2_9ACTN|nr:hypothetical protein [Solirubrobacter ginsenosidimutans]MDA0164753.1 hypothetical protein [Solirubrobacter ginsenosidimutans]